MTLIKDYNKKNVFKLGPFEIYLIKKRSQYQ